MKAFELVNELKIGDIVEVSGNTIRAEISGEVTELTRTYQGRVYPIGQIGSIVKIHFGRRLLFGLVNMLRMRSDELIEMGQPIAPEADQRLIEIELFAEGIWSYSEEKLRFFRGVTTYPLPRQSIYLMTNAEVTLLYKAAEGKIIKDGYNPFVDFAHYVGADNAICRANIDKLFAMHCAVLGSTGSGKSGAVAAILHNILKHKAKSDHQVRPRIIMIDPHGEYGHAFGDRAIIYRAYDIVTVDAEGHDQDFDGYFHYLSLPYWLMSVEEFRKLVIGKTESEATSQNNIILKAITHARMVTVGLVDAAPTAHGTMAHDDGNTPDYPRPKQGVADQRLLEFDADKPIPFSLNELHNHIVYLQAARVNRDGKLESVTATEFTKSFKSVLDKLMVLQRDPRIRFIMDEWTSEKPPLGDILAQLVGHLETEDGVSQDMRIIDISGLPNEIAGPLSAMIARLLFQYKMYQTDAERKRDPVVLVCEEAHRYVPDRGEAEYSVAQSSIRRIAREGRKYGIGLMLVSQRPADIESTVISQCGTWVVLRLTNAADQNHVARFLPDGLSSMTRALPTLGQQEALFVGEAAALPARIRIRDLTDDQLPKSKSAKFLEGWSMERLSKSELSLVAKRMGSSIDVVETQQEDL